jgi:GNAT superfamily N-acetyltransferase
MTENFTHRLAQEADLPALHALMKRAIEHLQAGFLSPEQVAASHKVMGLDSQLVKDQTYFIVELDGQIAGCGGWSYRSTLFGGDQSVVAREPEVLNPATDAARVRAMYTNPDFTRRGVGRKVMALCEGAARAAGFGRTEMMATMAGVPLYEACGYRVIAPHLAGPIDGVMVPMQRMGKILD